ncbi:MAG: TetR/AcrR family transcriptional regulator [Paracoccaceae bacterium]|nr:TetR/AcrR family transcriptional regulator [Paracoccaceae bacterium]
MSDRIKSDLRRQAVAVNVMSPSKSSVTQSAILNAATRFLENRQFRDLTVGILMQDAGYSRATFYQYFIDLHGLMETLLDRIKGQIIDGAQPWLIGQGDTVANLQESLRALVDVGYDQGFILKAVADASASDARLERVWESFLTSFDTLVSARIAKDQAAAYTTKFDPSPVAHALNRMDAAVLISSFGQNPKANKDVVLSAILRIWISTLYPQHAGKLTSVAGPQPMEQP